MSGDRKRQLRLQRTVFPSSGVLDVTSGVNLPPVKSGSCHMLSNPTAPCLGFPISNMRALVVPRLSGCCEVNGLGFRLRVPRGRRGSGTQRSPSTHGDSQQEACPPPSPRASEGRHTDLLTSHR